jgi:hypothetical protein
MPSGTTSIATNLDDNLRMIQSVVRYTMASDTIASATTCDLGTKESQYLTVSGTTTITGLGTISAGIAKYVTFSGALILTHNATSLILPTAANITTVAGDTARFLSLGSGNWRCLSYNRATGSSLGPAALLSQIGAAGAANTINNGDYLQTWNWSLSTINKKGLLITEDVASTGSSTTLVRIENIAGSTAAPFAVRVKSNSDGDNFLVDSGGAIYLRAQTVTTGTAGTIRIASGDNSAGSSTGGALTILSGTGTTACGNISITPGASNGGNTQIKGNDYLLLQGLTKIVLNGNTVFDDAIVGAPTISAGGGTGATIRGASNAFEVTMGTGSPTSVTVAFVAAFATAPIAAVATTQSGQTLHIAASTSTIQILSSTAFSSGTKVSCVLFGVQ